jgi:hypothetical protein
VEPTVTIQSDHCIECKAEIRFEFESGLAAYQAANVIELTHGKGFIAPEEQEEPKAICETCYTGKYNNPAGEAEILGMLRQIHLYERNLRNIEKDNFKQADARSRYDKYRQLVSELKQNINGRRAFVEIAVKNPDVKFCVVVQAPKIYS